MIEAIKLSKSYNGTPVLKEVSFGVKKGEIFCLLGQNGAGKTTTINLFLGFIEPTAGQALIAGEDVHRNPQAARKKLAYIPEVVQLYGNLTGVENLDFFSRLAGFHYGREALEEFLKRAGLQASAHHGRLATYSKGMRQKVGIAIALAKNANAIFMDEPTSGLDPKATAEFTASCKALAQEGKSIFMATHDIFNAVNVGSRIGIMREGVLVHTLASHEISAPELQQLYLETI